MPVATCAITVPVVDFEQNPVSGAIVRLHPANAPVIRGTDGAVFAFGPQQYVTDASGIARDTSGNLINAPQSSGLIPTTTQFQIEILGPYGGTYAGVVPTLTAASLDLLTGTYGWKLIGKPQTIEGIQGPGALRFPDAFQNYILTGLTVTAGTGLTVSVAAGTAYVGNPTLPNADPRCVLATAQTVAVPANGINFIDWNGGVTTPSFSLNTLTLPANGYVRLGTVTTGTTSVTSVVAATAGTTAFATPLQAPGATIGGALTVSGAITGPGSGLTQVPAAGLTGLTAAGDMLVGGTPAGGVAAPTRLGLPAFASIPASYLQYHAPRLAAGGRGAGFTGQRPVTWRGAYVAGTAYILGDTVGQGSATYVAIAPSTNVTPGTDATKWSALGPQSGGPGYLFGSDQALNVLDFGAVPDCGSNVITTTNGWTNPLFPAWSGATTYAVGARVASGSYLYQAIAASTNVTPASDATKWLQVAPQGAPANIAANAAATENSAAFAAAWYVASITGDQVYVPPIGGYWIGDQLVARISSGSSSNVVRMFGVPGQSANTGSWLLLTYRDPAVSRLAPANAKIVARGSGRLILEGLGISIGLANYGSDVNLTAPDTDFTPVALNTGAAILFRNCVASGNALANQAFDFTALQNWYYLAIAPHTDFLVCGDPADVNWGGSNGGFHGYGTAIDNCDLSSFRRILYARGANAANDIFVTGNVAHDGCGNIDTPFGGLIDVEGWALSITDNSLTTSVGGTGIRLAGQGTTFQQNGLWDGKVQFSTLKTTPPATWLTSSAGSGATSLATSGYIAGMQGLTAGGQPVVVESAPLVTLHSATVVNSTFQLSVDVLAGTPASDAAWLSTATFPKGGFARIFDRSAAGQPLTTQQEIWRVTAVGGSGPYTISTATIGGGSIFSHEPHAAGTIVQLYPSVVTQPFLQGQSQIQVNSLGGTAPDGGQIIRVGTWLKTMDVAFSTTLNTVLPLPGYGEWFAVTAVSGPDANGNYTLTLNRPASVTHTSMVSGQGALIGGLSVSSVTDTSHFVASSTTDLVVGTPVTINGHTATIQSIVGTSVTLATAITGLASGQTITAYAPSTIIEPWEQVTLGGTGQPTAASAWQLSTSLRPQALSIPVATTGANPALSAVPLPAGTQIVVQQASAGTPGSGVQLGADTAAVGNNEFFTVTGVDPVAHAIGIDHGASFTHATATTNVAVGPFTHAASALVLNHWSGHRVMTNTLLVANPLTRFADMPILHSNGYEQSDRFVVMSYAPQNAGTQQTTLAGAAAAKGTRVFTFAAVPSAWHAGTIVAIGPANTDGTLVWGKTDFLTISSISGTTVTFNVPPRTPTGGAWFPHSPGETAVCGPFVITTSPLATWQGGGVCQVGMPYVEEPNAGGNDVWISTVAPTVAGISLARENGPQSSGAGTSIIRTALGGMVSTVPTATEFARGIILPRFATTPNRLSLANFGSWPSAEGFVAIDGPNKTVTVELGGAAQPIATTTGYGVSMSGSTYQPALSVQNPTLSANFPQLFAGRGAADGLSTGTFAGSASGTVLGLNEKSGYLGNLIDLQVAGVSKLVVDATGTIVSGLISAGVLSASGALAGGAANTIAVTPPAAAAQAAILLQPTAAGTFTGSTSGTEFGINVAPLFRGNAIDIQNTGFDRFKIDYQGNVSLLGIAAKAPTAVVDGGVGSLSGDGLSAYQYLVTYNAFNGETVASGTISFVPSGAGRAATLTIPQGPAGISGIDLYRTQLGGSSYTRLSAGQNTINVSISGTGTVTYTDAASDASIAGNSAPPTFDTSSGKLAIGPATLFPNTSTGTGIGYLAVSGAPFRVVGQAINADTYVQAGALTAPTGVQTGDLVSWRSSTLGRIVFGNAAGTLDYGTSTTGAFTLTGGDLKLTDGLNLRTGTVTGMQIGTASTQKLGFYGTTAVVRPTMTVDAALASVTDANAKSVLTAIIAVLTDKTGGLGLAHEV